MVYKFVNKKSTGRGAANHEIKQNRRPSDSAALQLAEELHKPVIRKSKKEKSILDLKIIFAGLI